MPLAPWRRSVSTTDGQLATARPPWRQKATGRGVTAAPEQPAAPAPTNMGVLGPPVQSIVPTQAALPINRGDLRQPAAADVTRVAVTPKEVPIASIGQRPTRFADDETLLGQGVRQDVLAQKPDLFTIKRGESKFWDLSPDEQVKYRTVLKYGGRESLEKIGMGDIEPPEALYGTIPGAIASFGAGMGLPSKPVEGADPTVTGISNFVGQGVKYAVLYKLLATAGITGMAADAAAGTISGIVNAGLSDEAADEAMMASGLGGVLRAIPDAWAQIKPKEAAPVGKETAPKVAEIETGADVPGQSQVPKEVRPVSPREAEAGAAPRVYDDGVGGARIVWKEPNGKYRVSYSTPDDITAGRAPRGHDDYLTYPEAVDAATDNGRYKRRADLEYTPQPAETLTGKEPYGIPESRAVKAQAEAKGQAAEEAVATAGEAEGGLPKAKEPWEMTRGEYVSDVAKRTRDEGLQEAADIESGKKPFVGPFGIKDPKVNAGLIRGRYESEAPADIIDVKSYERGHRETVKKALDSGRPVPPEVLADYPDLAAKYATKPPAVPVAETATNLPAVITQGADVTQYKPPPSYYTRKLGEFLRRDMDEVQAQQILDNLQDRGFTPNQIHGEFWDNVYEKLPLDIQERFNRLVKRATGGTPETYGYRDWKTFAKDAVEAADDFEMLEGKERGLFALEAKAIERFGGETSTKPPTSPVGETLPPKPKTQTQQALEAFAYNEIYLNKGDGHWRLRDNGQIAPFSEVLRTALAEMGPKAVREKGKLSRSGGYDPNLVAEPTATKPGAEIPAVEKPVEKLPPVETVKPETAPAEPDLIGLKRAETDRLRQELELDPATPVKKRAFQEAADEAETLNLSDKAPQIADEVLRTGRGLKDSEFVGLVRKVDLLDKERASLVDEAIRLQESGNLKASESARTRAQEILEQQDRIIEASERAGSEQARNFSIRRMMLNRESLRLVDVVRQARAAKGAALTVEESARFEKLTTDLDRATAAYEKELAAHQKTQSKIERLRAERITTRETKKATITRRAATGREKILSERADIKKQLQAIGYRINDITGVSAEGSYLVGKLAVNYIKEGAVTLSEVVQKVLVDLPELTERDVYKALNARNPKLQKQARSQTVLKINQLKTQARLLTELENAEKGLFEPRKGIPQNKSVEIRALQKKLKELRDAAYKQGNSDMQAAVLDRTIQRINEVQDQLENQYRTIRKKETIPSSDVVEARQKLTDIRKAMRTEDALADLQEQMRTGQFRIPEKPTPKQLPPTLERRQVELKMARQKVRGAIRDMAPKGKGPKRWIDEIASFTRAAKATADMSATFRQGLVYSFSHPLKATRDFGRAFKATFSQYEAARIDNAIRSAEHQWVRDRAGVALSELDGPISKGEEMFASRLIERIPGIGQVVKASNRHMTTFLNLARTSMFDDFFFKNPNATAVELKAYADFVNVASGKGNLRLGPGAMRTLNTVLFAPKFAVSRFQTPYKLVQYWKLPRVRKAIAKDLGSTVGLGLSVLAIAKLAGYEVGVDPRSSDFGKIKVGETTRIDLWGGFQQPARLIVGAIANAAAARGIIPDEDNTRNRIWGLKQTGKIDEAEKLQDQWNKSHPDDQIVSVVGPNTRGYGLGDAAEAMGRFAAYKLSPAVTLPTQLAFGRDVIGKPVTIPETAANALLPMFLEDVQDAYRLGGMKRVGVVAPLTFLGVGASSYEASLAAQEKTTRGKIRTLWNEGKQDEAERLLDEWNVGHEDNPIDLSRMKGLND